MPQTYIVTNGGVALPTCDLWERGNYEPVLRKSTVMLTMYKFLRGKFGEHLAHFVTVAIFTSLCGSFWGTAAPLARIHHVYCTVLQSNSDEVAWACLRRMDHLNHKKPSGMWTALHYAAQRGNTKLCILVLASPKFTEALATVRDCGSTALWTRCLCARNC